MKRIAVVLSCVAVLAGVAARGEPVGTVTCQVQPCAAWASTYNGPRPVGDDTPKVVVASPDGTRLYVLARTRQPSFQLGTTILAYDASNGALLWQHTVAEDSQTYDIALILRPDGARLFAVVDETVSHPPVTTVLAFDTATGSVTATSRVAGAPVDAELSADGSAIVVVARFFGDRDRKFGARTIAFPMNLSGSFGPLWIHDVAMADPNDLRVATGPSQVVVAASPCATACFSSPAERDVEVWALDPATGAQRWSTRHGVAGTEERVTALSIGADGTIVAAGTITGNCHPDSEDALLLGLDPATGASRWQQRIALGAGERTGACDTVRAAGTGSDAQINRELASEESVVVLAADPEARRAYVALRAFRPFVESATLVALETATGGEVWRTTFAPARPAGGPPGFMIEALRVHGDHVIVAGDVTNPHSPTGADVNGVLPDADLQVAALASASGAPMWTVSYDDTQHGGQGATAITAREASVFAAGVTQPRTGTNRDVLLVRFDGLR